MIKAYKKKPVIVDALQYNGENYEELKEWIVTKTTKLYKDFVICGGSGDIQVRVGDYVVKGMDGYFYPVNNFVFESAYEIVG